MVECVIAIHATRVRFSDTAYFFIETTTWKLLPIPVCLCSCPFVCAAAICYYQHVFYTYFIACVLSACVICTLPQLGMLLFFIRVVLFFVALNSRVAFLYCALVHGTLALDLPTLIL